MEKEISEKDVDTYAQFVGDEVCLPDEQDIKLMDRVTKRVKENEGNPRRI